MKKISLYLLCVATVLMLESCSTTGGMFANLIPLPKFLTGKVENSIYYAKGGLFSIETPYPEGSNDYIYMEVKEEYHPYDVYVSFNTSTAPYEVYKAEVIDFSGGKKPLPDLKTAANLYVPYYAKDLVSVGWGDQFTLLAEAPWKTPNTSGIMRLYTTKTPANRVISGGSRENFYTAYHLLCFAEASGKLAIVDVSWLPGQQEFSPPPQEKISPQETDPIIIAFATNGRVHAFINSFAFGPAVTQSH